MKNKERKEKKKYDDDDGRTIADMSGVEHPSTWLPRFPDSTSDSSRRQSGAEEKNDRPWENNSLSKEERRAYILGALGAALMIGAVFIVGLGLLVWLLLTLWT